MKAENLWMYFMDTGAPEAYVLYTIARRMEENHVSECPGIGASDNRL